MAERALRKIETAGYAKINLATAFGRPARLEWLNVKQLVVDPEYQRDISSLGRSNVRKIAAAFNWSMFAPVIVAAAGGDKYVIVDGQHRTTAAALCGIEKVPCAIIEAKPGEQAAAFKAINGNVTKLSSMQLHYASLASGDERACRTSAVCKAAGVTILRYPKDHRSIAIGETMAVVIIGRMIQRHGEEPVTAALQAINAAGGGLPRQPKRPCYYCSFRTTFRTKRMARTAPQESVRRTLSRRNVAGGIGQGISDARAFGNVVSEKHVHRCHSGSIRRAE